jgi:hypothetical protein
MRLPMSVGLKIKTPARWARRTLLRTTVRGAKQEAGARRPFLRKNEAGDEIVTATPYQSNVVSTLNEWVDALVAGAVPMLHMLRGELSEQGKVARIFAAKRDEAKKFVKDPLKLGGEGNVMIVALVLACAVNFAITYDFVEEAGWPIAVTLIATLALVLLEIAVTALVGWGIGALVFDKPGSPHDLEPRERTETLVRTIALGIAVLVFVAILGFERGNLVWVLAALLGAALGAYLGAAACESKFHRAHDKLADETAEAEKEETDLREGYHGTQRQIWETGEWLHDEARRILGRGDGAFLKEFRAQHRNDEELPPAIPGVELLSPETIRERLTVPLENEHGGGQLHELPRRIDDDDDPPTVGAALN